MADLSPEDMERLRRLEEEVDRERDALKKAREALETKAIVPVPEPTQQAKAVAPVPKEPESVAVVVPAAWKAGLRKKVTIGTGVALVGFAIVQNIALIIACGAIVGGVWYFSGKYLGDESPNKSDSNEGANKS
jgi:hypothetical protein